MATNSKIFKVRSGNIEMMSSGGFPYEVSVENDGSLSTEINATVPSAPTNLSIVSGFEELYVSWSPPIDSGNNPISSYILEYSTSASGPYTIHSSSLATSRTIDDLLGGTEYFVRVKALNGIGSNLYAVGSETATPLPSVGDVGPGGGIIFYDAGAQQSWGRFLEAATVDIEGQFIWSDNASANEITQSSIGSGAANTIEIISKSNSSNIAAVKAQQYTGGGKTDWYLPSSDEIVELDLQKELFSGFSTTYWTSTRRNSFNVWRYSFFFSALQNAGENSTYRVRPIRAF